MMQLLIQEKSGDWVSFAYGEVRIIIPCDVTLQAAVYCRRENVNQVISIVRSDVGDV